MKIYTATCNLTEFIHNRNLLLVDISRTTKLSHGHFDLNCNLIKMHEALINWHSEMFNIGN